MPPVGKDDASGSPWMSSLPENSAIAVPSPVGPKNESCFSAVDAGQRLEPVRVVGRAALHRPLAHRLGDRVGERRVERLAAVEGRLQRVEDVLGQPLRAGRRGEDVLAEDGWMPGSVRSCAPRASPLADHWAAVTFCWRVLLMLARA